VVSWFVAQKIDLDFFCQWLGNRQIAPIIFFSFFVVRGKKFCGRIGAVVAENIDPLTRLKLTVIFIYFTYCWYYNNYFVA
jgi:hypothetical protein